MKTRAELEKRLEELDVEIAEARRRLPAHSVKPAVMHMLLELEDAYEEVLQQIQRLKEAGE